MRINNFFSWLLLCGTLAFVAASAQTQQPPTRVPGRIIAAKVQGTVTATNTVDQTKRTLATNDALADHHVINTGANSSVILIFSNGATLNIGADSTLSIDEFLQDPFADQVDMSSLEDEPTTSTTRVNLTRGELVGNVKHLRKDQGSTFVVNTPVGAAGIRGTTFRIVFRPDATGKVVFTLSTSEGQVLFEAPAAEGVSVGDNTEVSVEVDVEVSADGQVTITNIPAVAAAAPMSAESRALIEAATQQIVEASSTVVIAAIQADQAAAEQAAADKAASDEKAAAEKAAADKAARDKAAADEAASQTGSQKLSEVLKETIKSSPLPVERDDDTSPLL